jgi:hypothetical protein
LFITSAGIDAFQVICNATARSVASPPRAARQSSLRSVFGSVLVNIAASFSAIAPHKHARSVAQHDEPAWILYHHAPVERTRRVEAIVAVEDGLDPTAFAP